MKASTQQHTLAAIGFAAWLIFGVAGLAMPAQAHVYTYDCPGSGVLVRYVERLMENL